MISILVWAVIARLILEAGIAHPVAVGIVWMVGFVWLVGWSASGGDTKSGDSVVSFMAMYFGGMLAIGLIGLALAELFRLAT